ncbi:MAG TPA: YceI family protein, partial [Myxococcota bacterium]
NVTVQTKTLVNDDPNTRKQFGLDPTIPEKDRKTIEEHMKDDSQLDVEKFSTIGFASTSVEKNGDKLTLVGDFTLHGVTKKMRMPISFKLAGTTLTGDGKVRFLQSDWGIKPYSALLGAVKNKDEVVLNVHLVAVCP